MELLLNLEVKYFIPTAYFIYSDVNVKALCPVKSDLRFEKSIFSSRHENITLFYVFVTKTLAIIKCNSFVTVFISRYRIFEFSVFIRMFYHQDTKQNATGF